MNATECFKIRIAIQDDCWHVSNDDIVLLKSKIGGILTWIDPNVIDADPFLFVHNDRLYLFYEHRTYFKSGVIKMISTKDLEVWTKPRTVLKESYHLSFPYIYEENGTIYMIPETSAVREVRLYKAVNNDLTQFKIVDTLLSRVNDKRRVDIDYSDSVLYKKNNKYYLFTTINYNRKNELELYIADSLMGTYVKHPASPIVSNNQYGRNAGGLIEKDGKLYRVAQDCVKRYGDNVHLLEICSLSPKEYEERVIEDNLLNKGIDFFKCGGHQLNLVNFSGKTIVATDAKEYHKYYIPACIRKMLKSFHLFY